MSVFYDSVSKKTKPWVKISFILIPILLAAVVWVLGQDMAKKKTQQKQASDTDVF